MNHEVPVDIDGVALLRDGNEDSDSARRAVHWDGETQIREALISELPSRALGTGVAHSAPATISRDGSTKQRAKPRLRNLTWKNTLRHRRLQAMIGSGEEEVESAILKIVQEDTKGESSQIQALRKLAEPLTFRRRVKNQLSAPKDDVNMKSIGIWTQFVLSISITFQKTRIALSEAMTDWALWSSALREIEGHFGSGVGTYFRFLRRLFLINIFLSIIILGLLFVPNILMKQYPDNVSYPGLDISVDNARERLAIYHTQDLFAPRSELKVSLNESHDFNFMDIFTGEGWLNQTDVFYGSYSSGRLSNRIPGMDFVMPEAYFFTMCFCIFIGSVILSLNAAFSYKQNFIMAEGENRNQLIGKIFCGWDYSITSQRAADMRSKSIFNDLKDYVEQLRKEKVEISRRRLVIIIGVNISVIFMVACSALVVLLLLDPSLIASMESWSEGTRSKLHLWAVPLIIAVLIYTLPVIFSALAKYEDYSNPRMPLYVTLFRLILMQATIMGCVVSHFIIRKDNFVCWENFFGQMIYRLMIMDFLIFGVLGAILEFIRKFLNKKIPFLERWGNSEFQIARNIQNLLYSQTLVWLGLFFCPFIPIIASICMFVNFYLKKFSALMNQQMSARTWRAAQAETVYLCLAFVMQIITLVLFFYMIISVPISKDCGPFRDLNITLVSDLMLHLVDFWDSSSDFFLRLIAFLQKGGIKFAVILFILAGVYYLRIVAHAHSKIVDVVRQQLTLERKDKAYLLRRIEVEMKSSRSRRSFSRNLSDSTGSIDSLEPSNNVLIESSRKEDFSYDNTAMELENSPLPSLDRSMERERPVSAWNSRPRQSFTRGPGVISPMQSRPHQLLARDHSSASSISAEPAQQPPRLPLQETSGRGPSFVRDPGFISPSYMGQDLRNRRPMDRTTGANLEENLSGTDLYQSILAQASSDAYRMRPSYGPAERRREPQRFMEAVPRNDSFYSGGRDRQRQLIQSPRIHAGGPYGMPSYTQSQPQGRAPYDALQYQSQMHSMERSRYGQGYPQYYSSNRY
ncbi:unnamed protein product [Darwinula stevensoni]|uniref:TMC domain-containing protein n=1 Tax=Darwinula stevensoni TaxID=69355 RepID=A0A7R8ZXQ3_9CRUS|nr:unnamed protein product [Darwinula stevensoni]CAG0879841.1 unnamed protein product [Darwinula stevensoni]